MFAKMVRIAGLCVGFAALGCKKEAPKGFGEPCAEASECSSGYCATNGTLGFCSGECGDKKSESEAAGNARCAAQFGARAWCPILGYCVRRCKQGSRDPEDQCPASTECNQAGGCFLPGR